LQFKCTATPRIYQPLRHEEAFSERSSIDRMSGSITMQTAI
jgi:hypothetical protein